MLATALVAVPAGAQESELKTQDEVLAGDYVGTLVFWATLSGLGPDGGIAKYDANGSGPVSLTLSETGAMSGTWENHFDSVSVFGQQEGTVTAVNQMDEVGRLEGDSPSYRMTGTQTGTSKVTIESGVGELVRDISLDPQSFGPIALDPAQIDCNELWYTFAPAVAESAEEIGWQRYTIRGLIMVVPVNADARETSLFLELLNQQVRQAMKDLFDWADAAKSAAAAGEQPDIRPAQGPISALESVNATLDAVSQCDPLTEKGKAQWRSLVTDAIRDMLNDILGHSPADVTFTPSTLNDMATVGARAAALGEGATDTSGQLASNIQSAAADTAAAGGDSDGLARLDARLGGGT